MTAHFRNAEANGVCEQHQNQTQSGHDAKDRRLESDIEQSQPRRAEHRAERQKDADLGQVAAVDEPGEQRGDDDNHTHQRQSQHEKMRIEKFHEDFLKRYERSLVGSDVQ